MELNWIVRLCKARPYQVTKSPLQRWPTSAGNKVFCNDDQPCQVIKSPLQWWPTKHKGIKANRGKKTHSFLTQFSTVLYPNSHWETVHTAAIRTKDLLTELSTQLFCAVFYCFVYSFWGSNLSPVACISTIKNRLSDNDLSNSEMVNTHI